MFLNIRLSSVYIIILFISLWQAPLPIPRTLMCLNRHVFSSVCSQLQEKKRSSYYLQEGLKVETYRRYARTQVDSEGRAKGTGQFFYEIILLSCVVVFYHALVKTVVTPEPVIPGHICDTSHVCAVLFLQDHNSKVPTFSQACTFLGRKQYMQQLLRSARANEIRVQKIYIDAQLASSI